MPTSEVECRAPPGVVWDLLARPSRWREWSPYVVGASGLGSPTVEAGAEGHVVLRGGVRLPARILSVDPGCHWSWEVGGVQILHAVGTRGAGSRIRHELSGHAPHWSLLATGYLPAVALVARNLSRVAEREARRAGAIS